MASSRQSMSGLPGHFRKRRRQNDRVDEVGINPARLDRKITLEVKVTTQNELGSMVPSWQTFAEPWAEIKQVTGGESIQGNQLTALATHLITIRYLPGVNEQMRVRLPGGSTAGISNANNLGLRNVVWLLTCMEDKTSG